MKILVLNAGSSSQKSCLYEIEGDIPEHPPKPIWEAQVDWHLPELAKIKVKTANWELQQEISASRHQIIGYLLDSMHQGATKVIDLSEIDIVGHRVVHGGKQYQESVVITQEVIDTIQQLATLAPAHNPANLEGILAIKQYLGNDVKQVAVFDTAFHSHIPDTAAIFPGVYEWVSSTLR